MYINHESRRTFLNLAGAEKIKDFFFDLDNLFLQMILGFDPFFADKKLTTTHLGRVKMHFPLQKQTITY